MDLFEEQVDIAYLYGFGEPLLNPYFCDMVSLLNEKVGKVRTVTNGTLLNKELNTQLAESGIDYIRISVEALSSEGYMSVSGANIDFNKFVENIYDLYDKTRGKTEIGIRIISEGLRDQSEAKKIYDIFKPFSDYASIDNVRAIWPGCEPKKASALGGGYYEPDNYYDRGGETCSCPLYSMTIHSSGVVSACPDDWNFLREIGDVNTQSLYDIWRSAKIIKMQKQLLEVKREDLLLCKGCKSKSIVNIDGHESEILQRMKGIFV